MFLRRKVRETLRFIDEFIDDISFSSLRCIITYIVLGAMNVGKLI